MPPAGLFWAAGGFQQQAGWDGAVLKITTDIAIAEKELKFDFIRASGPGGQNVNKVATVVQLHFDARNCTALSEKIRTRLRHLAGRRMTADGVLVIRSQRFRSQERNRQDAVDRLANLIRRAARPPKARIRTRPGRAAKERLLAAKRHRSRVKKTRHAVSADDF